MPGSVPGYFQYNWYFVQPVSYRIGVVFFCILSNLSFQVQVINVSSPNTPGLRKLQGRKQLKDLVKRVRTFSLSISLVDFNLWTYEVF